MHHLRIWAPKARDVGAIVQDRRLAMTRDDDGWWRVDCDLDPPFDYSFVVDGDGPLPDPRSPWQPRGPHGPSRTLDHSAFAWTDARWQAPPLGSGILYELHVGTFTPEGTFDSVIAQIPHLLELGVTHVELMPVAEFPGDWGWGYDGVDLYAPHHAYGGPDGLKRLVDALHSNGLAAVLDVVYNHLGPSGNYLARFGPYFTEHFRTPWGDAVNLSEAGCDEVRRFFIDNAVMWLRDYHFDGLRLDAVHALIDPSATHLLEELACRVHCLERELGRHVVLIAESDQNDPRLVRPRASGGFGLTAQWSDDFHHAMHTLFTGQLDGYYMDFGELRHLAKAIEDGFVYDGCYSAYRRRRHGRPLDRDSISKLLGYLQNHDQVGNRAQGDRMASLTTHGRLKAGAAFVILGPFIPMLFQGEEWGATTPFLYFTSHSDSDLGRAVSEGRRREFAQFGWEPENVPDPQAPETFLRSKLDWSEPGREPHRELLEWHRALIALRKSIPELRSTDARVQFDEREGWICFRRGPIEVLANFGGRALSVPSGSGHLLLASDPGVERGRQSVLLPVDAVAVLGPEPAGRGEYGHRKLEHAGAGRLAI